MPAEVAEPGTVLVLGRLLADISRNLPDRPIDVATDGNKVQVTCGSSRFSLLMMPADDYPTLPTSPEPSGTIAGDVFTQAVAQVSVAADRGDTLPILTGVRVEIEGDKMTLLATDRYRLAMRELHLEPRRPPTPATSRSSRPARCPTPPRLARAPAARSSVALGTAAGGDGLVGFEAGQRRTTTRLLDGEYPKVTSIFPTTVRDRGGHQDRRRSSRRSSAWRSSPSATPRCGCGSPRARSPSRPAPATTPRRPRRSRPRSPAPRSRSPSTRSSCSTAWAPSARAYSRLSFTQASRPAVLSGQAEADGEADTSYRYVLMPVRFAC